ncbi:MAG: ribosome maturation factor RimM [Chloroflexota bacterium]
MSGPPERIAVGLVRGLHGLRGAVRVEVLTDRPDKRFAPGARVWVAGRPAPLTILEAVPDGKGLRVRFEAIPDRTAAESLRDALLEVGIDEVPAPEGDAVYWHELVGVEVRGVDGTSLGTVRDVYRAGATEVLVVDGGLVGPFDLPVVKDFIRAWTPREGVIIVDADGLDLAPPTSRKRRSRGDAEAPPG